MKEIFTLWVPGVAQGEGICLVQITRSINDRREISHCYPEEVFITGRPSHTQKNILQLSTLRSRQFIHHKIEKRKTKKKSFHFSSSLGLSRKAQSQFTRIRCSSRTWIVSFHPIRCCLKYDFLFWKFNLIVRVFGLIANENHVDV